MDKGYAENFFNINRWILKMAGLWRPDSKNQIIQYCFTFYAVSIFLYVNVYFTTTEFLSFMETAGHGSELIKNISFALTHFMGACKVIFFYYYEETLKKIMNKLESVYHYDDCIDKNYYPGIITQKYKKEGIFYTILFLIAPHATLFSSYIPPTVAAILYDENDPNSALPNRMPYYSWMPFKFDTKSSYLIGLGYQSIAMFSYGYSIVGMDTLFWNLMRAIRMHLEIIHGAIITIRERVIAKNPSIPLITRDDELYDSKELLKELKIEMKKIVKHLQLIYDICHELEEIYLVLNLLQAMATLFILCSCLYLVTTSDSIKQIVAEIIYLCSMGIQIYFFCKGGDEVTQKAAELPMSLWECDWLSSDTDFKKSMIQTMHRVQKPLLLTAGKFVPLTLTTFVGIIKASYSMFAVIKTRG